MLKTIPFSRELRILVIMAIIALGWHLLTIFGSFFSTFADLFVMLVLSWILAFILEPVVVKFTNFGVPRILSSVLIYLIIALSSGIFVWLVLPQIIAQIVRLSSLLPGYLPPGFPITSRIESFLSSTASSSIALASGVASTAANLLLVVIFSFYFLASKEEISKFILKIIPDEYEETYLSLEKVFAETFASFLRVQVVLGLGIGLIVFLILLVLGVEFALSTSLLAAIFAMIPVIGPIIFLIPVALAAMTSSLQTLVIAVVVCTLAAQLVYNIWAPKLLGEILKINPIIILLSFIVGFKLGGVWGAIFAVPVVSAATVIIGDFISEWKKEVDEV